MWTERGAGTLRSPALSGSGRASVRPAAAVFGGAVLFAARTAWDTFRPPPYSAALCFSHRGRRGRLRSGSLAQAVARARGLDRSPRAPLRSLARPVPRSGGAGGRADRARAAAAAPVVPAAADRGEMVVPRLDRGGVPARARRGRRGPRRRSVRAGPGLPARQRAADRPGRAGAAAREGGRAHPPGALRARRPGDDERAAEPARAARVPRR